jgi:BirA family biotin operon repressor/biotin-[acetyl-CoA-carboxylase] ligase
MSRLRPELVRPELAGRSFPWDLRYVEVCESTQDLARRALGEGAAEGTLVITDEQLAGRGRSGNRWVAAAERALLFSVVLFPPPQAVSLLPLLAGIAVMDGIGAGHAGVRLDLKWPNDVLSDGRKLAGILVEHPPGRGVVLGVGVNVNLLPEQLPPGGEATSLSLLLGREIQREPLLASILNHLDEGYGRLVKEGSSWVPGEWRRRSSMLGQTVSFSLDGGTGIGIAEDLAPDGALIIRLEDGRLQRLISGEVSRVRVS